MPTGLNQNALTTVDAVKDELDLGCDDVEQTDTIVRRINAVSAQVERFLSRKLRFESGKVETLRSYGGVRMRITKPPLVTLTAITIVSSRVPLLLDPIELGEVIVEDLDENGAGQTGIVFRDIGWPDTAGRTASLARDPLVGSEEPGVRFTYDAGYVLPQQADDDATETLVRTLPFDLEEAVILAVVSRLARRGGDIAIKSESSLSGRVTFDMDRSTGLPSVVAGMLRPYRIFGQGAF